MKYNLFICSIILINNLFRLQATDKTCDLSQIYLKDKRFCEPCVENCIVCDNDQECQKCKDGFYLDMHFQCQKACQIRQFKNQENSTCQMCTVSNCLQCSNFFSCDDCMNGFQLSEDKTQCLECKDEDQIILNGQKFCSYQCYAHLNTVFYENCLNKSEFQDQRNYYSVFQTQSLETLLQIQQHTTAITLEDIIIGITQTQVHLFHTYPNLQLYKVFNVQYLIVDNAFGTSKFLYLADLFTLYQLNIFTNQIILFKKFDNIVTSYVYLKDDNQLLIMNNPNFVTINLAVIKSDQFIQIDISSFNQSINSYQVQSVKGFFVQIQLIQMVRSYLLTPSYLIYQISSQTFIYSFQDQSQQFLTDISYKAISYLANINTLVFFPLQGDTERTKLIAYCELQPNCQIKQTNIQKFHGTLYTHIYYLKGQYINLLDISNNELMYTQFQLCADNCAIISAQPVLNSDRILISFNFNDIQEKLFGDQYEFNQNLQTNFIFMYKNWTLNDNKISIFELEQGVFKTFKDDNIGIFTFYQQVLIVDLLNFKALFSCNFTNTQNINTLMWLGRDKQLKIEILYNFYQVMMVNYYQQTCNIFNLPLQQYQPKLFMDQDHKLIIVEFQYQPNILIFEYPSMNIQYNFNRNGTTDNFINNKAIKNYYSKSLSTYYYSYNNQSSDYNSIFQLKKTIDISQINYIHEFKNTLNQYVIDNEFLYIINQNIKTLNKLSLQNNQIINNLKLRKSAMIDDINLFHLVQVNQDQLLAISYDICFIIKKVNLEVEQFFQIQNTQIILPYNGQYVFLVKLNIQNIYELQIFNSKTLAFQIISSLNIEGPDYIEAKIIQINTRFVGFRIDSLQIKTQQYFLLDLINLQIISQIHMDGIKSFISCQNDIQVIGIVKFINQNYEIDVVKITYTITSYQISTIKKINCNQLCYAESLFSENNEYFIILSSGELFLYLFNLSSIQQFNVLYTNPLKQWVRPCYSSKLVVDNQYIYIMCPFISNIYSLISLRYIGEIKTNAFRDSYIESIHNFDKNFFLVFYNNKIELYEIQKYYKKLIKTISQIFQPKLISPPSSFINKSDSQTRQITLQILSDYMIFMTSISYKSFQFIPKYYQMQQVDFVQIVINQIEDFQQICATQVEQNSQNLRYQLYYNTSKILNPFPVCDDSFFSRNNVIEYTSSLDQTNQPKFTIFIQDNRFIKTYFQKFLFSNVYIKFKNVNSINLIPQNNNLKLLQFQNVSFQSDSYEINSSIFSISYSQNQLLQQTSLSVKNLTIQNSAFAKDVFILNSLQLVKFQNININSVKIMNYPNLSIIKNNNNYQSYSDGQNYNKFIMQSMIQNILINIYNCQQPLINIDSHQSVNLLNIQIYLISIEPQSNIIQISLTKQVFFNQLILNFEEKTQLNNNFRVLQQINSLYIIQFQGIKQINITNLSIDNSQETGVIQASSLEQDYVVWENLQIILDKITLKNSNQIFKPYLFSLECLNVTLINNNLSELNVLNDIYNIQSSNKIEVFSSIFQNIQLGQSSVIHIINSSNKNKSILFYNTSFVNVNSVQTTSSIKVESLFYSSQKIIGILNITNCTFKSNINNGQKNTDYFIQNSFGGSIYVNNFQEVLINEALFNNNTCFTNGGAILFYSIEKISVSNSNFTNCRSLYSSGGAIFIDNTNIQYPSKENYCVLNSNRFMENSAVQEKGGAIFIKKSNIVLKMNILQNNLAIIGGAIFVDPKYFSEINNEYNIFTNNQGLLYGNNVGSDPQDIKFVDKSGIPLNQTLFILDQFQSGNYTKKGVYLQFFDKENKIFKFQDIKNATLSENIQLELKNYTLEVSSQDQKDNIAISNGTLLELQQYEVSLYKLNITAAYKNENTSILTIKAPYFLNLSINFKIEFRSCQIGEIKVTRNEYVICEECGPTTYSLVDPNTYQGQIQCKQCPEEALLFCYGNHLKLKDGFWRSSVLSDNVYTCKSDGCSETKKNINFCIQGYTGPLCESCDNTGQVWQNQYGKREDKCLICSDINSVFYYLAIVLLVYFLYAQLSIKSQITSKQKVIRLKYLCKLRIIYLSKSIESGKDSSILVKIFLSYIQIFSSTVTVFSNSINELYTILNIGGDPSQATSKGYDCIMKMSQIYPNAIQVYNYGIDQYSELRNQKFVHSYGMSNIFQKKLTLILVYSLVLQDCTLINGYGKEFYYFVILFIILINLYGVLIVTQQYFIIQKANLNYLQNNSIIKYLLKLQYFKKLKPSFVSLLRVSSLWKLVHQKLIQDKKQISFNIITPSIKVEQILIPSQHVKYQSCVSSDLKTIRSQGLLQTIQQSIEKNQESQQIDEEEQNYQISNYTFIYRTYIQAQRVSKLNFEQQQATDKTCDLSYIYLKDKRFCEPCIENCIVCDNDQECQKCKDGFYLDMHFKCQKDCQIKLFQNQENSTCQRCTVSNCLQCSNIFSCDNCMNGYQLSDDKTQCLECKEEDQIVINGQKICSFQCYAHLNTVFQENCQNNSEFEDKRSQFSVFQTQSLETLLQLQQHTTAITQEDIIIGITQTQVHLFHTYPNLQLYKTPFLTQKYVFTNVNGQTLLYSLNNIQNIYSNYNTIINYAVCCQGDILITQDSVSQQPDFIYFDKQLNAYKLIPDIDLTQQQVLFQNLAKNLNYIITQEQNMIRMYQINVSKTSFVSRQIQHFQIQTPSVMTNIIQDALIFSFSDQYQVWSNGLAIQQFQIQNQQQINVIDSYILLQNQTWIQIYQYQNKQVNFVANSTNSYFNLKQSTYLIYKNNLLLCLNGQIEQIPFQENSNNLIISNDYSYLSINSIYHQQYQQVVYYPLFNKVAYIFVSEYIISNVFKEQISIKGTVQFNIIQAFGTSKFLYLADLFTLYQLNIFTNQIMLFQTFDSIITSYVQLKDDNQLLIMNNLNFVTINLAVIKSDQFIQIDISSFNKSINSDQVQSVEGFFVVIIQKTLLLFNSLNLQQIQLIKMVRQYLLTSSYLIYQISSQTFIYSFQDASQQILTDISYKTISYLQNINTLVFFPSQGDIDRTKLIAYCVVQPNCQIKQTNIQKSQGTLYNHIYQLNGSYINLLDISNNELVYTKYQLCSDDCEINSAQPVLNSDRILSISLSYLSNKSLSILFDLQSQKLKNIYFQIKNEIIFKNNIIAYSIGSYPNTNLVSFNFNGIEEKLFGDQYEFNQNQQTNLIFMYKNWTLNNNKISIFELEQGVFKTFKGTIINQTDSNGNLQTFSNLLYLKENDQIVQDLPQVSEVFLEYRTYFVQSQRDISQSYKFNSSSPLLQLVQDNKERYFLIRDEVGYQFLDSLLNRKFFIDSNQNQAIFYGFIWRDYMIFYISNINSTIYKVDLNSFNLTDQSSYQQLVYEQSDFNNYKLNVDDNIGIFTSYKQVFIADLLNFKALFSCNFTSTQNTNTIKWLGRDKQLKIEILYSFYQVMMVNYYQQTCNIFNLPVEQYQPILFMDQDHKLIIVEFQYIPNILIFQYPSMNIQYNYYRNGTTDNYINYKTIKNYYSKSLSTYYYSYNNQSSDYNSLFQQKKMIDISQINYIHEFKNTLNQYVIDNEFLYIINQNIKTLNKLSLQNQQIINNLKLRKSAMTDDINLFHLVQVNQDQLLAISYDICFIIKKVNLEVEQFFQIQNTQIILTYNGQYVFLIKLNIQNIYELHIFNSKTLAFQSVLSLNIEGPDYIEANIIEINTQFVGFRIDSLQIKTQQYLLLDLINLQIISQLSIDGIKSFISCYYDSSVIGIVKFINQNYEIDVVKITYMITSYQVSTIQKINCNQSCYVESLFQENNEYFIILSSGESFSYLFYLSSIYQFNVLDADPLKQWVRPCYSSKVVVDNQYIYIMCPFISNIYSMTSLRYIGEIKTNAFRDSYIESIHNFDKNFFLVFYNNKIELYEIQKYYKKLIKTIDQIIQPKLLSPPSSISNKSDSQTCQIILQILSDYILFRYSISYTSFQFIPTYSKIQPVDFVQIVVNQIEDQQEICSTQVVQNSQNLRYQLYYNTSKILNPFPVCDDSFFSRNNVIEYTSSLDQANQPKFTIFIQDNRFIKTYFQQILFSNVNIKFKNVNSLNLISQNNNLKLLQFQNVSFQSDSQQIQVILSQIDTLIFSGIQINDQTFNQQFIYENINTIIFQNFSLQNIKRQTNLEMFIFKDVQKIIVQSFSIINSEINSSIFSINYSQNQQPPQTSLFVKNLTIQNSAFVKDIFIINSLHTIKFQTITIISNDINKSQVVLINCQQMQNQITINEVNIMNYPNLSIIYSNNNQQSYSGGQNYNKFIILSINNSKEIGVIQATSLEQDYVVWENLQIILDKITLKNSNQIFKTYLFNIECLNVTLINNNLSELNILNDIYNIKSSNKIEVFSSIFKNIQLGQSSVIHIINSSNKNQNILFYNTSFVNVNSVQTTSSIKVESLFNSAQKILGMLNITNCTFDSNINNGQKNIDYFIQSSFGGSIYVNNFQEVLINEALFNNNTCFTNGGAILFYSIEKISVSNSNFTNCRSLYSSGGAIFIDNTNIQYPSTENHSVLNSNRFIENSAIQEKGGALFIKKSNIVLKMNTLQNNLAVIGGAIFIDPKYKSEMNNEYNKFTNNQGLLYGNNVGSDPQDIKFVDKSGIPLNQTLFILDQFQSGNYTKKGVYLQFFDKENKIFKFQDIKNATLSENIQLELKNYTLEVSSQDQKDNIAISNGTLLELQQYEVSLYKLNITAAYKNENTSILTIKAPYFLNLSINFKIEFRSCQIGEIKVTRNQYVICEECGPTTYSLVDPNTYQGQVQCKQCPEEALLQFCYGNHLKLKDGFWRSSVLSDNVYTCKSDGCSETKENINFCIQGYTGPLCESCDNTGQVWQNQYGKREDKCLICSDINSVFYYLAIVLLVYFLYAQLSIKSQITSKQKVIRLKYLCKLRIIYLSKSIESSKDSSILVKIFLSYIQIFSSTVTVFSNSINELYTILNIGGDPSQATSKGYDCIMKMSQIYPVWLNRLTFQLLQIFWILFAILIIQKLIAKKKKRKFYSQIYIIFIYLFFYPSLSKMLISLIFCQKIEGKLYLLNDFQQECFTKIHLVYSLCIIYPITFCWAFVIPYFLYRKMSQHQQKNKTHRIDYILSYYFLQQGYKSKFFYWEIVRMLYKLTIMVLINILSQEIRSLIIALVCLMYFILVQSKQPFHSIVYINIEKKLTLILVYSLVLQDCALINGYGQEFYYLAISVIILINLYGVLIVTLLYFNIQKANLNYLQNNIVIKKILEWKYFKKLKPSFVNLLRVSSLWKLVHQKLIKDRKQIICNSKMQSIKIEDIVSPLKQLKFQSCVSSDLNTVRTQGLLLTIQQTKEKNQESEQNEEDQVIRFPSSSFSFS
ncbi:hypothetical protein ABPG73_022409 [Tetrahymena malaccensis]